MLILDILMTPLGSLMIFPVIGLVFGFAASRIDKTLGVRTGLFAGALGSWSGGIGMFAMIFGKGAPEEAFIALMFVGQVLGALIFLFVTYLSKNLSLANSPAASQNFSEAPVSQFCTQCGNRRKAGLRYCPACGSAGEQ